MSDGIDYPAEYDNSGRVENAAELIEAYTTRAAAFRARGDIDAELGLAYGSGERNRLDLFWPNDERGRKRRSSIVVFIHGEMNKQVFVMQGDTAIVDTGSLSAFYP